MSLQRRLLLGFGGLWLILLIATLLSVVVMGSYSHSLETLFHENYDSVVYCDRMRQALDELNLATQSAVWAHIAPQAEDVRTALNNFHANADQQYKNCTLPGEKQLTTQLIQQGTEYQTHLKQFSDASEPQRQAIYQNELLPRYRAARTTAGTIGELNLDNMRKADIQIKQNIANARDMLVIFLAIGAVLAVVSVIILAKALLSPIKTLMTSVRQIEAGDLDSAVPVQSRDEIGQLAEAFNAMAARLREYRRIDHARLLRTQQTTQLAIDSLYDAVVVFNPAGRIEISNHQARLHFGLEPGRELQDIALDWLRQLFTSTLETGHAVEPRGYQSAIQLFDAGEERFLLPRAVPMFDEQKHVIGVAVTLVDVTRLRHADELKSDLVSTVSHELKTPLTSTRMAVHMLAQQSVGTLNPKQLKLINAAKEDTDRLHRIIENLLNMSRIEAGQRTLNLAAIAPATLVEQALAPLKADFDKKGITLTVNVPAQLPAVRADPTCIGHVLTNLLSNALKFTPPQGRVEISAIQQPEGVRFTVSDSGPGIAAENLPRLFEKFFRVPLVNGPPGAGLGLSIAKEIAEAHGGAIRVDSTLGQGSLFTFTMPLQE